MDIQKEREAFEKQGNIRIFVKQCLFDEQLNEYSSKSLHDYTLGFINGAWWAWQAKAQAVPEGFVLAEKSKIRTWYQDDDEPENFCNSESDLNCLGDCLDDDDIITVNIHESAHISTRKVFGVWKSNSPTDIQSNFVLVDSREKAEEIVASNKAMIEAQEPAND